MSLPASAVDSVNLVPVSCTPSPESPAKRIATRSRRSCGLWPVGPTEPCDCANSTSAWRSDCIRRLRGRKTRARDPCARAAVRRRTPGSRTRVGCARLRSCEYASNRNPIVRTRASAVACQRASLKPRVGGADTQAHVRCAETPAGARRGSSPRAAPVAERARARDRRATRQVRRARRSWFMREGASRCFSIVVRSLRNGASASTNSRATICASTAAGRSRSTRRSRSARAWASSSTTRCWSTAVPRRCVARSRGCTRSSRRRTSSEDDDSPTRASALEGAAEEPSEILLEDELDHAAQADARARDDRFARTRPAPLVLLSKFRGAAAGVASKQRTPPAAREPSRLPRAAIRHRSRRRDARSRAAGATARRRPRCSRRRWTRWCACSPTSDPTR